MASLNNIVGTLLMENDTAEDMILTFPDPTTTGNFLQVQTISGDVQVKGAGKVFGQNSNYIPVSEGQFMNFAAVGNINPIEPSLIKLAPGAIVTFVAYD